MTRGVTVVLGFWRLDFKGDWGSLGQCEVRMVSGCGGWS